MRAATRRALGEKGMKNHAIRWMAEFRTAVQVCDNFDVIKNIIEEEDVGCASLMESLLKILRQPARADGELSGQQILRLELALIKDVGEPIAYFCNHFEGDGFLSPYAYDHWYKLNEHLRSVVYRFAEADHESTVRSVAREFAPGNLQDEQNMVEATIKKAEVVLEKLESDTETRFSESLQTFRGCRLVGYQFVRETTLEALQEEIIFVQYLPIGARLIEDLEAELKTYKNIADHHNGEDDDEDDWAFWRRYFIRLPAWYKLAEEAALVMCSSAAVERVFSLLNNSFDDSQQSSLNDYKESSVMIRYNENFREKKQYA